MLVLLRTATSPAANKTPNIIECVVCDTRRGLRLSMHSVVEAEKDVDGTVAALEQAVQRGFEKLRENITEIVAVPPLVSDDLGFQFNYLQSAYAKLIEQTFLEQHGVLVVELGEAQAIATELRVTGGSSVDQLQMPVYAIGHFRHV